MGLAEIWLSDCRLCTLNSYGVCTITLAAGPLSSSSSSSSFYLFKNQWHLDHDSSEPEFTKCVNVVQLRHCYALCFVTPDALENAKVRVHFSLQITCTPWGGIRCDRCTMIHVYHRKQTSHESYHWFTHMTQHAHYIQTFESPLKIKIKGRGDSKVWI